MRKSTSLVSAVLIASMVFAVPVIAAPVEALHSQDNYQKYVTGRQAVDLLIAEALQAFKAPARVSHAGFTGKLPSNMEIVAERLQQAAELEPYRVDLLFSTASAYIYNKDIDKAIALYRRILEIAPDEVDAHSYLAAWCRYEKDTAASDAALKTIETLDPGRAQKLKRLFETIDRIAAMPLRDTIPDTEAKAFPGPVAVVTLGYALNPDGSMHDILIQRLEKTLELAQQLPDALIIVTGGVPQNNQTEARLMARWLVDKGVASSRIYQDNFARSTVENALYSRYALTRHQIRQAIILSSGSHVRRAQAMFEIAGWETGPRDIAYTSVSAPDKPLAELQKISDGDLLGIYRDSLKALGLWSFRSYPLEER